MQEALQIQETCYFMEMRRPDELRPARPVQDDVKLKQLDQPASELRRWMYEEVGGNWNWRDRADWTHNDWGQHFLRPDTEIWILWLQDEPAGYFELEKEEADSVQITHCGLRPQFTGRGLGGYLLTLALRRAWAIGAARVWLITSSSDHPNALANYQARGLNLYKTEVISH